VFDNRVLRRIFGPKRKEVAGGWRRLHNEELHNFYASPNIVTEKREMHAIFRSENLKVRDHSEVTDVCGS
jgi:hypothetical protein